jgi:hypothetical protein
MKYVYIYIIYEIVILNVEGMFYFCRNWLLVQ